MKSFEFDRSFYTFSERPTPMIPINQIKLIDHLENKFNLGPNSSEISKFDDSKCLNVEKMTQGKILPRISFRNFNERRVSTFHSQKMVLVFF